LIVILEILIVLPEALSIKKMRESVVPGVGTV